MNNIAAHFGVPDLLVAEEKRGNYPKPTRSAQFLINVQVPVQGWFIVTMNV
jgi:hypothetical protein